MGTESTLNETWALLVNWGEYLVKQQCLHWLTSKIFLKPIDFLYFHHQNPSETTIYSHLDIFPTNLPVPQNDVSLSKIMPIYVALLVKPFNGFLYEVSWISEFHFCTKIKLSSDFIFYKLLEVYCVCQNKIRAFFQDLKGSHNLVSSI